MPFLAESLPWCETTGRGLLVHDTLGRTYRLSANLAMRSSRRRGSELATDRSMTTLAREGPGHIVALRPWKIESYRSMCAEYARVTSSFCAMDMKNKLHLLDWSFVFPAVIERSFRSRSYRLRCWSSSTDKVILKFPQDRPEVCYNTFDNQRLVDAVVRVGALRRLFHPLSDFCNVALTSICKGILAVGWTLARGVETMKGRMIERNESEAVRAYSLGRG